MPLERAEMLVDPGDGKAFDRLLAERAVPLLRAVPGVGSVAFGRGMETPHRFLLLVDWATLDDHDRFTASPAFGELTALLRPFTRGGGMEHFAMRGAG